MPSNAKNIAGQRFSCLTALSSTGERHKGSILWNCVCDCGNTTQATVSRLKAGDKKTCSKCHLRSRETVRRNKARVGYKKEGRVKDNPAYEVWCGMIKRCENSNCRAYKHYGGRGITVCDRWRNSFEAFLEDVDERPSSQHSIDRIDVNGNYEPSNCRWATAKEQAANKRNNVLISANGKTQCLQAWADELGLNAVTIIERIERGWTPEKAVTTDALPPAFAKIKWLTFQGKTQSVSEWSRDLGIGHTTIFARLKRGWTVEKALSTPISK